MRIFKGILCCIAINAIRAWLLGMGAYLAVKYWVMSFFPGFFQNRVLRAILNKNRKTPFGIDHNFSDIKAPVDYSKKIEISDFEKYRSYIDRFIETGKYDLSIEKIYMLTTTSGTTGKPKAIPQSRNLYRDEIAKYLQSAIFYVLLNRPFLLFGKWSVIVSGQEEKKRGQTFKSSANEAYSTSFIGPLFAVPGIIFDVSDYEARYYYIAIFSMVNNAKIIATPNPKTIIRILSTYAANYHKMVSEIIAGELKNDYSIEAEQFEIIAAMFKQAAKRRNNKFWSKTEWRDGGQDYNLWPGLTSIMCWKGGNCNFYIDELRRYLPSHIDIFDLGYIASDSPALIHAGKSGKQIGFLDKIYLEFVDENGREFLYHQLKDKKKYRIITTNRYGFYRYDINDIMEVDGFYNRSPYLKFVQKCAGFSNITGEKLSESQVLLCIKRLRKELGLNVPFFVFLPNLKASSYDVFIEINKQHFTSEAIASCVDKILKKVNVEYESKRESDRLKPPVVTFLRKGAYEMFKSNFRHQKDAQFKVMVLQNSDKFKPLLEKMTAQTSEIVMG
jgi:GH3 auxin-responsive promoter